MKNIVITGTSRGIGFEMVRLFSELGHNVLALSRNEKPIAEQNIPGVTTFSFDICKEESLNKAVNFIDQSWGRVDILVNNAGLLTNKPFEHLSSNDFRRLFEVNVFGVAELTRRLIPYMKKESHVVNVSSMGGVQGSAKFPGLAAYSSSKGALLTLTELLAEEYKENGPAFNALALGAVQTEMLQEAFPGYKAPVTAVEMAEYIVGFSLKGDRFYNGKIMQVSNSTP